MIRRATPRDVDAIAELYERSFATLTFLPVLHTLDEHRAHFARVLDEQDVWVFENGGILGFAACDDSMLNYLYVEPEAIGSGVGAALYGHVLDNRPDGFTFWVFQQNERARHFYEAHGARPVRFTDGQGNEERMPDVLYASIGNPELALPFVARGQPGEVHVRYVVNGDPARWGFEILGLGDVTRASAFPVTEARVSYGREGYEAIFGWIQIVRYWSNEEAQAPASTLVDVAPQFRGLGIPFLSWGIRPIAFDAPCDTPEGHSRWEALTFLTQSPDGLMTRVVEPVVGFRWGHLIDPSLSPAPQRPAPAQPDDWTSARATLAREYPDWTFG